MWLDERPASLSTPYLFTAKERALAARIRVADQSDHSPDMIIFGKAVDTLGDIHYM
jgi:hypothetical protein